MMDNPTLGYVAMERYWLSCTCKSLKSLVSRRHGSVLWRAVMFQHDYQRVDALLPMWRVGESLASARATEV